ncbi:MAG: hypothetical protein DMG88_15965 [Acidobacteria bacterium]|nr:MAG: hypothetical protein DMG88_15965 [Acidobacteriota bacterium]
MSSLKGVPPLGIAMGVNLIPAPQMPDLWTAPAQVSSTEKRLPRWLKLEIPEAWVRFLLAIVGLTLAFGAAMFSTVSRESGNLWATLIFASLALLLATIVGLTTVPYLARRVATSRVRDAVDYDVTPVGIIYVVTVLLIGIAALNTGNNLLYIIVAAMLAAVLISGIASAAMLRDLEVELRLPDHVFAGTAFSGAIVLRNRRRWAPAFSISVLALKKERASKHWQWTPAKFSFPPGRPAEKQWLQIPDRQLRRVSKALPPPGIFQGAAYFPYVPAKNELTADLELRFDRRGRYQQDKLGVATRFPFAFLRKTRRVALAREIIVYPSVEPADEFFQMLPLITGEFESFTRGRGSDLYRIREYMPEDSARHVDWKATAKSGSLKVREFSREDDRKLRIVFDNPPPGVVPEAAYESAVTLAASLAWHFAAENTTLSFAVPDLNRVNDVYDFLSYLALVEPRASASPIEGIDICDEYNIILTSRPRASIPTVLWTCSYFVFMEGHL